MKHGAGWIVLEQSHYKDTCKLLSILPARQSRNAVAAFMQQCYVDRFASIRERISYKKHPKASHFCAMKDQFSGPIHVGHDPFFVGIYSDGIFLKGDQLTFGYRIAVDVTDTLHPVFEARQQTLTVDA